MSKWTPGKWVATGELVLLDNRPKFRELIASTNGAHNSLANARLIASAPEMAELLAKFAQVDMSDGNGGNDEARKEFLRTHHEFIGYAKSARALLDKVNG